MKNIINNLSLPIMLKSKTVWSALAAFVAAILVALNPEFEAVETQMIELIAIGGFGLVARWSIADWIYVFVQKDYPEKYKDASE